MLLTCSSCKCCSACLPAERRWQRYDWSSACCKSASPLEALCAQVIGNLTYDSSLGVYTLDCGCTCVASLPWVTFVLQGQTFSLPASAYMMQAGLSLIVPCFLQHTASMYLVPPIIW